jgi:DNA mismatch endonuclease (patch repair protein)
MSKDERSRHMARIRYADTKPELTVRKVVHRLGYRYRLHVRDLPGCPDIVFRSRQKVIFVHGCFWHQHPGCRVAHIPKSRLAYWIPKLEKNCRRDVENERKLRELGWRVLTLWECEVRSDEQLRDQIISFLESPGENVP